PLSVANSPDGGGRVLAYFVSGDISVKDDQVNATTIGIAPPTAAPLSATLADDLSIFIDDMKLASRWTGTDLASGPTDDNTTWELPGPRASGVFGGGAKGTVTPGVAPPGGAGNSYPIQVVVAGPPPPPMSAAFVVTAITVTLGTDGGGLPDPTLNTA